MTALAQNRPTPNALQSFASGIGYIIDAQVGATEQIYVGSFVTLDTSDKYAAALVAGDSLYGISTQKVLGTASNGGVTCAVLCEGVITHALSSVAVADIGKPVYATDDQTLTLTNDGTDTLIGRLVGVPATGTAIVKMTRPRPEATKCAITSFTADMSFAGNSTTAADGIKAVATVINILNLEGMIEGTVAA